MRGAGEIDDPGLMAAAKRRKQTRGQRIMAEIVGAELHLKAVDCRLPLRQRHHAGIVDQKIERGVSGNEARGEFGHRGEARQIERFVTDLGVIAPGEHHVGTGACQRQRGFIAKAAGGAGNHSGLAVQGRNVSSGPVGHAYISCARFVCGRQPRDGKCALGASLQEVKIEDHWVSVRRQVKSKMPKKKTGRTALPSAPGLRERKRRQTRERLTRVAMALFLERGFEATTLDDIAAAADISRRSFFHYFASKEDVVFTWQEESTAALIAAVAARPANESMLTAAENAISAMVRQLEPGEAMAMARLKRDNPALRAREKPEALVKRTFAALRAILD